VTVAAAQAGTPVTFTLHDAEGRPRPLRVTAPAVLPRGPMLTYPPVAVSGNRPFVVIGCRYSDVSGEPIDVAGMNAMIGTAYPGMGHYFAEVSAGAFTVTGSTAAGWATLPQAQAYYNPLGVADPIRFYTDCMGAHDAAVNFPDYDGVVMVINGTILGTGYFQAFSSQATIPVTIDGQAKAYHLAFIGSGVAANEYVWAHQIGHTLDLQHSSGQPLASLNSWWDMMSKGGFLDPIAGRVPVHLKAVDKQLLGWIPAGRVYTASPGSNLTITLERSAQPPATANPLLAIIPIGTNYYTVEARKVAGYDRLGDSALAGEGVIVHQVVTTRADPLAELMDTDANGNPNDAGGFLVPGEFFADQVNRVKVTVLAPTTTGYQVRICLQAAGGGTYGDVNGDGTINVIDAQIVARFSVGLSVPDQNLVQTSGDVNGDGSVNVIDAQVIARHAVGLSTAGSQVGQAVTAAC
jgi:M6 family metalloprotease-like protein